MKLYEEQLAKRQGNYSEQYKRFIQTGGYVSPTPNLWEDVLISISLQKPILLKGPSGSGKTRLAQTVSHYFGQPMVSVNCSVDLDAESLLGFKTIIQKDGQSVIDFVEGPVVQAMKYGLILYIDEINMAKPDTLPILHSVLDHRRVLTNPFTGEVIEAHENFTVIAAINEGYIGTSPMNEALKNRFIVLSVPYLTGKQLKEVIQQQFPKIDASLLTTALSIHQDLRQQVENGLLAEEAASIRSLLDALALAAYMPLERAIWYAIAEKMEDDLERQLIKELVLTWIK